MEISPTPRAPHPTGAPQLFTRAPAQRIHALPGRDLAPIQDLVRPEKAGMYVEALAQGVDVIDEAEQVVLRLDSIRPRPEQGGRHGLAHGLVVLARALFREEAPYVLRRVLHEAPLVLIREA